MQTQLLSELNSPLSREQAEHLSRLVADLRSDQLTWISGYLAGLNAAAAAGAPVAAQALASAEAETATAPELTILYGSQTGNAENIARDAAARAEGLGFRANVLDMADIKKPQLKAAERLLVIVSTHGEGEPPDTAMELHDLVGSKKAPPLKGTQFSVLALGDTSYEYFCQTGRDFDERLEALGGTRIHPRSDCDVDYEETAEAWIDASLSAFAAESDVRPSNVVAFGPVESESAAAETYTKKNPLHAAVLDNQILNGRGSAKETRHIELSVEDSGMSWQPGDAIGVLPRNDDREIAEVLETLGFSGSETVPGSDGDKSLGETLATDFEITTLTRPFLEKWADLSGATALRELLSADHRDDLRAWMWGRQIIDVLTQWPVQGLAPTALTEILRRLPPRLYSIASSHTANPDEIHLTVAAVRYESHARQRQGVASTWLADRLGDDDTVPVYIDANRNFKLPENGDTPIIMIGPGTGVAPFRAFLEEREAQGHGGRNWLFFGDQHFRTDFLYQRDFLRWREQNLLDRIDVAFSRDQAEKVYVQHKLRERGGDIWNWVNDGAHVYVCGDADAMAPDVHQTLVDLAAEHGGMSSEDASGWLARLQKDKRYQRDVY